MTFYEPYWSPSADAPSSGEFVGLQGDADAGAGKATELDLG